MPMAAIAIIRKVRLSRFGIIVDRRLCEGYRYSSLYGMEASTGAVSKLLPSIESSSL